MDFPLIDPVALQIGPIAIRWYALSYLAGFILGWQMALRLVPAEDEVALRPHKRDIDDFFVWAIPAVILGGRLGYVLFYNFNFYLQNPFSFVIISDVTFYIPSVFAIWEGGMSFHGGVMGVGLAMLAYSYRHRVSFMRLSDTVCAVAPIGLFFGRIANFINAELYGRVTDHPFGVIFPGTDGQPRHPSQLYEAMLEGVILFTILALLMRKRIHKAMPGLVSGLFIGLYGIFRFLIEYVREPDAHLGLFFEFISMGQMLCLPMIIIGGIVCWLATQKRFS